MSGRAKLSFSHMGVFLTDINKMADLYSRAALNTAEAIDLPVPLSFLLRADEVRE